jgi:hypothetical protein
MCAAILRLPLTSTLLAVLQMGIDGVNVTPEVVVAVAVAFVITNLLPVPGPKTPESPGQPESETHSSDGEACPIASAT